MGRRAVPVLLLLVSFLLFSEAKKEKDVTELQIGVKFKPKTCHVQAHKGDQVKVHYRGSLTDGSVFDESYARGDPIDFELGSGQVIKGQALIFFFSIFFVCSFGARNHSLMAPCLTQAIYP
jgi:FK506-binding protein 2